MIKTIAILVALFAIGGMTFGSAFASSWDKNPLERFDIQKRGNTSYPLDFNKHDVVSPKSYGWKNSKVCGLDLCIQGSNVWKQPSHLQGAQISAPQTLGDYLGLSATGDKFTGFSSSLESIFDGKYYIKGFFK